ncbi:uncharacterized protein LOC116264426 isoform X2 [Nymphaea colorata]|uniref:uncharacterized protein LOC116264426 isoform X2 n=1 Tax=Nymphaea colorata TaxID=210225 RepID=UPI00129DDAC1|nr:uncharacterized protein LOC116264426 isoform X2 [Nymphaea colorata]
MACSSLSGEHLLLFSRPSPPLYHQRPTFLFPRINRIQISPSRKPRFLCNPLCQTLHSPFSLRALLSRETPEVKDDEDDTEFIEIGYVSNVHGLDGEVRVKPSTDFPEMRFEKPGKRWLRSLVSGRKVIREVELTSGRAHAGPKSWILSFAGVDTVEMAKEIVGSSILVREDDRPPLEDGDFYTPDLIGMKVYLKEWKQKKRTRQRLLAAKKKLADIGQQHILEGLSSGDKDQKLLLTNQITNMNLQLFQHALHNISKPKVCNCYLEEFVNANSAKLLHKTLKIPKSSLHCYGSKNQQNGCSELRKAGFDFIVQGKVATVLALDDGKVQEGRLQQNSIEENVSNSANCVQLHEFLLNIKEQTKVEENFPVALIMASPANEVQTFRDFLVDHDYYGLDKEKVWILEEDNLPVVSNSAEEKALKILLKTPWEVLHAPVGSGSIFNLLSTHTVVDNLSEIGIEYVQVCSLSKRSAIGYPLLLGHIHACKADVGIKIFGDEDDEFFYDMVFSLSFLRRLATQMDELQFFALEGQRSHVQKIDNDWVVVHPLQPNSYILRSSIYSCLRLCPPDKVCMLHIEG